MTTLPEVEVPPEEFLDHLRQALEGDHIPLWQARAFAWLLQHRPHETLRTELRSNLRVIRSTFAGVPRESDLESGDN